MTQPAPTAAKRILVVEDDPAALEAVRQILSQQGYEVFTAADGDAAVELLRSQAFDLAILDINLPGLISGYDLCRGIRADQRMKDIPVIFLTAREMVMDEKQAEMAGSDLYLVKPVLASRLVNMVGMFLSPQGPLRAKRQRR